MYTESLIAFRTRTPCTDPHVMVYRANSRVFSDFPSRCEIPKFISTFDFSCAFQRSGRLTLFLGDLSYSYGATSHTARPISDYPVLGEFVEELNLVFPFAMVNSVLLNCYPNGNCHLPLHSDNEPEIDPDSYIFTFSLGRERIIEFAKNRFSSPVCKMTLKHGDLIIFSRSSQNKFLHGIPRDNNDVSKELDSSRLSITFRRLRAI